MTVFGYSTERMHIRAEERRYAFSGAFLLSAGFALQLTGYAWEFWSWWLLSYAAAVAITSFFVLPLLTKGISARFYAATERAAHGLLAEDNARVEARQRQIEAEQRSGGTPPAEPKP